MLTTASVDKPLLIPKAASCMLIKTDFCASLMTACNDVYLRSSVPLVHTHPTMVKQLQHTQKSVMCIKGKSDKVANGTKQGAELKKKNEKSYS